MKVWLEKNINKRVLYLQTNYMNEIKAVSYNVRRNFPAIPIGIDDLSNILLFKAAQKVVFFIEEKNAKFKPYFLKMLYFEGKNAVRKYVTNKHKIMNFAAQIDETNMKVYDKIKILDVNEKYFTKREFDILEDFYVKKLKKSEIYMKYNTNKESVLKMIAKWKRKWERMN